MAELPLKYQEFSNRLTKNYQRISKIARKRNITSFRVYDLDLPDFPFMIDIYHTSAYVAEYDRNHTLTPEEKIEWLRLSKYCISMVLNIPIPEIFIKERKSIKSRNEQYNKLSEAKKEYVVEENGLKFKVNLSDYLDTGLFLDHRLTRQMVKDQSKGKNVLNLFAYTGSFSVYAAAGGADQVLTLDLSNTYIQWSKDNFELNGLKSENYQFVAADVLENIELLKPNNYDIIVLDPPSFSNSKKMKATFNIQSDHWWLINKCLLLLKDEGKIIFSTNLSKFQLYEDKISSIKVKNITNQTKDFDFERKLTRQCYLITKSI
jgi:23S rRNA (cytosine1962-C5)-methyltransferase